MEVKAVRQPSPLFSMGKAYWSQRHRLASMRSRLEELILAVDHPGDLHLYQWAQLGAAALEFKPDLIIELGRGRGNSTCLFTEVAHSLGPQPCKVLSLCLSDDWERITLPKISPFISREWLSHVEIHRANIGDFDFSSWISKAERVMLFWDAHGFDVAECVLGVIIPQLVDKDHLIAMHDLTDARFSSSSQAFYGDHSLWKGNNWEGPRLRLGHIDTAVEQAVAVVDFTSRNRLRLKSADESIHQEIGENPEMTREIQEVLGSLFSFSGHWFYFSLNERDGVFTFPRTNRPVPKTLSKQAGQQPLPDERKIAHSRTEAAFPWIHAVKKRIKRSLSSFISK